MEKKKKIIILGIAAVVIVAGHSIFRYPAMSWDLSDSSSDGTQGEEMIGDGTVPDRFPFVWITAGRPYAEDIWDYDVYEEIGNYTDKVLLMHGNADSIVPISYSERAAETYEDADYYVIDGATHDYTYYRNYIYTILPYFFEE